MLVEERVEGDTLFLTVSDDGPGISERSMHNLFQVGYSTKFDPETGNINRGVGLPAVKSLTEELGGSVSVESQPGRGAFFRGAAAHRVKGREEREMRIYIAEDDPSVIGGAGGYPGEQRTGPGAAPARRGAPDPERIMVLDPDLVLVDLLMPGRDGIQLVRELKELGSRAKFVMISQVSAKELIAKAYQAGVEFFIQKPINLIEVRQVVGNVIRQMENEGPSTPSRACFRAGSPSPPPGGAAGGVAPAHPVHPEPAGHGRGEGGPGTSWSCASSCWSRKADGLSDRGWAPLCSQLSDSPKTMEQRVRRAVERGWAISPAWGGGLWERVLSPSMPRCSSPFLRCGLRWPIWRGKRGRGKVNLRKIPGRHADPDRGILKGTAGRTGTTSRGGQLVKKPSCKGVPLPAGDGIN